MNPYLIGNSFPLALIRRRVEMAPMSLTDFKGAVKSRHPVSFWGHSNTLPRVSEYLGADLTPTSPRPILTLSKENLPQLETRTFDTCWVVAPNYSPNFRPQSNEEVPAEKIVDWHILNIQWAI